MPWKFLPFLHDILIHTQQTLPVLMLHWKRGTGKISTEKKEHVQEKTGKTRKMEETKNRKGKLRISKIWLPL